MRIPTTTHRQVGLPSLVIPIGKMEVGLTPVHGILPHAPPNTGLMVGVLEKASTNQVRGGTVPRIPLLAGPAARESILIMKHVITVQKVGFNHRQAKIRVPSVLLVNTEPLMVAPAVIPAWPANTARTTTLYAPIVLAVMSPLLRKINATNVKPVAFQILHTKSVWYAR